MRKMLLLTTLAAMLVGIQCPGPFPTCTLDETTTLEITLYNVSSSKVVSGNLRICPNGMPIPPHFTLDENVVLAPGESVTYRTDEIASTCYGSCERYNTEYMVGLCGWSYGDTADDLVYDTRRFGGQIGVQFTCGDSIVLAWTDGGDEPGGNWVSEIEPGEGNPEPQMDFMYIE